LAAVLKVCEKREKEKIEVEENEKRLMERAKKWA